jgi:hypothetical protein
MAISEVTAVRTEEESDPDFVVPFDPRTEVSADAKYIVKKLILWFFVLPLVITIVVFAATR